MGVNGLGFRSHNDCYEKPTTGIVYWAHSALVKWSMYVCINAMWLTLVHSSSNRWFAYKITVVGLVSGAMAVGPLMSDEVNCQFCPWLTMGREVLCVVKWTPSAIERTVKSCICFLKT